MIILLLLPLMLDEAAANARFADLRVTFARHSKQQSMRDLERLVAEAPGTTAAAGASEWLGDLWRTEHDDTRAEASYLRAHDGADLRARVLAARGLGNIAIDHGRYTAAARFYAEARAASLSPQLDAELDLRLALARKLRARAVVEWSCWAFVAATIAWLFARSRFWSRPRLPIPTELLYIVPMYVLLIGSCIGRDAKVLRALWLIAGWSAALVGSAGLAAERRPLAGRRRLVRATLLALATAALLYAATNRAGILDSMLFTVTT